MLSEKLIFSTNPGGVFGEVDIGSIKSTTNLFRRRFQKRHRKKVIQIRTTVPVDAIEPRILQAVIPRICQDVVQVSYGNQISNLNMGWSLKGIFKIQLHLFRRRQSQSNF